MSGNDAGSTRALVSCKEAGKVLPEEHTSPSPGPGSVQAGGMTARYSTENRRSSARDLGMGLRVSKKPVSASFISWGL